MPWHDSRLVRNEVAAMTPHAKFAGQIGSEAVRMVLREIYAALTPLSQVCKCPKLIPLVAQGCENAHCIATHARHTHAHAPKVIVRDLRVDP